MFDPCDLFGHRMQQTRNAIPAWSSLIQTQGIERIVEIGTGAGIFSLYLLAEMMQTVGGEFHTWDIVKRWEVTPLSKALRLERHFHCGDVFKCVGEIEALISDKGKRVAVFCDGGNKRKELRTFYPFLKPKDVIAVHDWGWAVSFEDRRGMKLQKLEQSKIDPLTAFFERVSQ